MPNRLQGFLLLAAFAILGGCGGGSGGSSSGGAASAPAAAATGTTATASSVQLLVSSPQMPSSGATTVGLTAIALDSSGQVVPGRTVTFSAGGDASAFINTISGSGVSDSNGLVTAVLNLGSSKANRTITVSATVDGKTATNTVSVTGTTVSFSGNNSLAFGASGQLTISVKDSAGNIVPFVPVAVTSKTGNTVALSDPNTSTPTTTTNANGLIAATVTVTQAGNDVLTGTAAGVTQTQNLTISTSSFSFTSPSTASGTPQINVNTATPLSVLWTNSGAAVVNGSVVTFTASRGTISAVTTTTGGTATASIQSASAGPSIITASGSSGTPSASINVNFVATSASSITVQANPSTLQPTTGAAGQTSNISTISAVVRDAANNLVQNAQVDFSIAADSTGGKLSAATAVTDASGTASVNYIAGAVSGAQNGVKISAVPVNISGAAINPPVAPVIAQLTVGGSVLFVRLGTDNLVTSSPPNYIKTFSALVTDSAGNPVPSAQVQFVLRPVDFRKGIEVWNGANWAPVYAATCGNEDVNFNGTTGPVSVSALPNPLTGMSVAGPIAIATNDYNGNGRLDPGNVASVNATATTDANGFALANISYAKNYAYWATVTLQATAVSGAGNDPPATANYLLQGAASDFSSASVAPPGQTSPFGAQTGCNNAN